MDSHSSPARMSVHADHTLPQPPPVPAQGVVPPGGHVVTDSHGIIQSADEVTATMLMLSQRDLNGQSLPAVLGPDNRVDLQTPLRQLEEGEPGLEWEITLAPGGRRSFPALLTVSALRQPSGRITSLHWMIRDISAWRRWAAGDQVLQAVSEHTCNGFSLRHSLSRMCEPLNRLLSYPLVQVAIREAETLALCAQAGTRRINVEQAGLDWTSDEQCRLESVLDSRTTLHLQETPDPADGTTREGGQYPSRLLVPLCAKDGAVGVLVVHGSHRETFDPGTIQWFEKLAGQMTYCIAMHQAMTVRREMEARIVHLAYHDSLTGLPNRLLFSDRFKQAIAHARRHGRGVGVLFIDLDHFKAINDSLGHETGDAVLKIVAGRLTHCMRATDTVARLSGDEFAVILQDVTCGQDAGHVARKVLESVRQTVTVDGQRLHTTASVGIAVYPFNATSPDVLLAQADRAMYRAKEQGGHSCQFFSDDLNTPDVGTAHLDNTQSRPGV